MKKKPDTLIRILSILMLTFLAACTHATPVNPLQTATFLPVGTQTHLGITPQTGQVIPSPVTSLPSQTATLLPTETPTAIPSIPPTATLIPTTVPTPLTDLVPAGASLRLGKGPLLFADLSSDGKTVFASSRITVCSYQVTDGHENWCRTAGEAAGSTLRGLSLSPDGKTILTGLDNGRLILWDSASGAVRWVISAARLNTQAWSPDSTQVVVSTRDTHLVVLDASNGGVRLSIQLEGIPPSLLSWSPDGKLIAAGDDSGQVAFYNAGNGQKVLAQHFFPDWYLPTGLAWSPDSTSLLVSSSYVSCSTDCIPTYDGRIVQVDAHSGQVQWQMDGKDQVKSLSLSPDGSSLLARVGDGALNLYQVKDGSLVQSLEAFGGFGPFWLPDGKSFLSVDGKANLVSWDLSGNPKPLSLLEGYGALVSFAWSPDSKQLAASPAGGPVLIWDAATGKLLKTFADGASDGFIDWSPDGKNIATLQGKNIIIRDVQSGKQEKVLANPNPISTMMRWSPDGKLLAGVSQELSSSGEVKASALTIWETSQWTVQKAIQGGPKPPLYVSYQLAYVAWSPDGTTLASADGVLLWDAASGKQITPVYNYMVCSALQWSPDGVLLVTDAGWLIDINRKYPEFSLQIPPFGSWRTSAAFSPDGRFLAAGQERIVLHSPKDGTIVKILDGAADQPDHLAFSPDSKLIASLSEADGTVILWKVP